MSVSVNNSRSGVTVKDDKVTITVNGGIGPQGPAGAGGVTSLQGLSGALTLAAVGGTWSTAGSTITLTVTGGAGAVTSVAGRTGAVVLAVADVSGAVATTDSRLSDAREWSAATVTQAQAEAGTDTSRLAFTVLRVWQAIAAWWAASASKTKLDGIAAGATANQTDAYLLSRANHTGTQAAATISDFSAAAVSAVTWTTLTGKPSTFTPPVATAVVLGGVKQGSNTTIAADGTISVAAPVTSLPYSSITGTPTLATVATTGSAADLTGTLAAARLPNTTVTAGSYGSASSVATFTVDAAGRLTAAGSTAIAISAGAVSGLAAVATAGTFASLTSLPTTLAGYGITDGLTASSLATPPAIGGTTPAAGTFTILAATSRANLPSGAAGTPAARDIYTVADTIRYRDSTNSERTLLNSADNLANLGNTATARTNLGLGSLATQSALGNITSAGAIGSTSGQVTVTGAGGVLTTATIGTGLSLSGGVLTSTGGYTLPAATTTTLGGIIAGPGLSVAGDGTLTVNERLLTALSSSSLSGSTTETSVASVSLTAVANDVIRGRVMATITNNSGASVTYTWRIKLGATTIATLSTSLTANTAARSLVIDFAVAVISTTSQVTSATATVGFSNSSTTVFVSNGTATETLSSAKTLDVTFQMSASTGTPSAPQYTFLGAVVERSKG